MVDRTYPCCSHCAEDIVHDIPENGHTISCDVCDEMPRFAYAWDAGFRAGRDWMAFGASARNPYAPVVEPQRNT